MYLNTYENEILNQSRNDEIRKFCQCEKINEEYFRASIKETFHLNIRNRLNIKNRFPALAER